MQNKNTYKSLVICSMILGILISVQLKTINLENNGTTTSKNGEELAIQLKGLKKEQQQLEKEVDNIKKRIDEYKKTDGNIDIKNEIEKYEILAGYTDVSGPGIEIKISSKEKLETDNNESIIYNYDLLLSLINKLNSAQASAISINNERVVANTYMHLEGDKLLINDKKIIEPIMIKAIGDSETLSSAIQIKYGIIWEMEKYCNLNIEILKKDNLDIDASTSIINIDKLK